ncbi:hypothetical protein Pse7367_1502 [Thalassoporum mexicanum PCC 7367]|uniref:hypothetical protein n=1 Tax=Thalassoporum mexicanum TaxID=3457544 RepID=UPI00029F810C|nr:hypothetical protein [Pseudanabaena sp. PCC 7367]AFY69791.1 hypothetical protein Pse7367_1502 [Pseudanabaena sp. PCC 7367]
MKDPNRLLEQARQGNVKVIAALMNRQLKSQGMMADIHRDAGCLDILIESDRPSLTADYKVPNQEALVTMIEKWLLALEVKSIAKARVSWQLSGQEKPAWRKEFWLAEPEAQNLDRISEDNEPDWQPIYGSQMPATTTETTPEELEEITAIDEMITGINNASSEDELEYNAELARDLAEIPPLDAVMPLPQSDSTQVNGLLDNFGDFNQLSDLDAGQYDQSSRSQEISDINDNLESAIEADPAIDNSSNQADTLASGAQTSDRQGKTSTSSGSPTLVMQVAQFTALSVVIVLIMMGLNGLFGQNNQAPTEQSQLEQVSIAART